MRRNGVERKGQNDEELSHVDNECKEETWKGVKARSFQQCLMCTDIGRVAHRRSKGCLHDVVLSQATVVRVHGVTTALGEVLDVAESKLAATVLVSLELGDGSISRLGSIEAHDTGTTGAAAWFVLDLGLLDLSDCSEELDQVFIAGGPRQLQSVSART